MPKAWFVLFASLLFSGFTPLTGQDNFPSGARYSAMANTGATATDVWANYHNQAGLGSCSTLEAGYHFENKYVLVENALQALAIAIPAGTGSLGISLASFGSTRYRDSKIGLAYGKRFGERFAAGVQINLHSIIQPVEVENNASTASAEGGIQYRFTDEVIVGFHVFNLSGSTYHNLNKPLSTIYSIGTGWQAGEKLFLTAGLEKDTREKLVMKGGAEYQILHVIYGRLGLSSSLNSAYSFGIGFAQNSVRADIAFSSHFILGYTPHLSLAYIF